MLYDIPFNKKLRDICIHEAYNMNNFRNKRNILKQYVDSLTDC